MAAPVPNDTPDSCIENGVWTPLPVAPPHALDGFTLRLKDVDSTEYDRIKQTGVMTCHIVGCTGDYANHQPQQSVAAAMAAQVSGPGPPGRHGGLAARASFLYHLGDVVYKDDDPADPDGKDQRQMYRAQFYQPYTRYARQIFAIAGNHDGKHSKDPAASAIDHFLANFRAARRGSSPDNSVDSRPAMTQPYVYWRLDTPLAYVIGLYSNVANGGILDDPHHAGSHPHYDWLVAQLRDIRQRNDRRAARKVVLLAVHYPPYSGAANFARRGDPTQALMKASHGDPDDAEPIKVATARPLAVVLQQAFLESGQIPDAVISAHAHLYQRLTYRYDDGREVPYLIAGSGGHAPVENMWEACDKTMSPAQTVPFAAVLPPGLNVPPGHSVRVVAYDDRAFGFLRLTITARKLLGEFFTVEPLALADSFRVDLTTHRIG